MTPQSTEYLTLNQVAKRFPGKSGGRIHPATITRWILMGCLSRDGVRVKLSATRVGSRWLVDPSTRWIGGSSLPPFPVLDGGGA